MNEAEALTNKRQAILRSVLFWAGFFAFFFLVRFVVGMFGATANAGRWYGAVMMIVVLIVWTRFCLQRERLDIDPGITFSPGSVPRAFLGLIVAAPLCGFSLIGLKWFVPGVEFHFSPDPIGTVLTSAALFLVLAAYEEIGFRGYPLVRLLPGFGIWPTLLLIAPVFVLYHLSMGWPLVQAAIGTGVGSLLFGMAAVAAKRGLAFPIGVHAGWNYTTWCLTSGSGPWRMTFSDSLSHRVQTAGMVLYVSCMLVGTVFLWAWVKRKAALSKS